MPESTENPFKTPREARSVTITIRMTPAEHETMKALAKRERVEIVDLIREALALLIDGRHKSPPRKDARR